jgi:4'-phosphopantetheinyl transferase
MIHWKQLASYDLSREHLHLWLINVDDHDACLSHYFKLLTIDEYVRANRFKFDKDRNCFVISRACLKILLSRYLNCAVCEISFRNNQYGKPAVVLSGCETSIRFNLSHSHCHTLIAIVRDLDVGVDIEYMRENPMMREIVARCFSENECEEFKRLPETQKLQGFYNIWTRKEAFTKAVGKGILYPLNKFEVSLDPQKKAQIITINGDNDEAKFWHLHGFTPEAQYCAAVSWKGLRKDLTFYRF